MNSVKHTMLLLALAALTACSPAANTNTATNTAAALNTNIAAPNAQTLTEVPRPQKIVEQMKERGEQDNAAPTITVLEPKNNQTVSGSTVKVKLSLSGDLKGYKPMKDMTTGMGNHIHLILDNEPYEPFYNAENEFEFRNVADGTHTLRVFPSRPWHESYKNAGAFQMVKFTVKNGGANTSKPAATNSNQLMSNANSGANNVVRDYPVNKNDMPLEGKDMPTSAAGAVDVNKPLLTYSRPKGEYKGADADAIMIDFWITKVRLQDSDVPLTSSKEDCQCRVRYSVDGGEPKFIDIWNPIWLSGWTNGTHKIKLELIDKDGNLVENGGYNSTTREITVAK